MTNYEQAARLLRKNGELHQERDFYVAGNPYNPKAIILFEKGAALEAFQTSMPNIFYIISGLGVPSKECIKHVAQFEGKRIFYFGDMDPTSFWTYLTFSFGRRDFSEKAKLRFDIKFLGLTAEDCKNFLEEKGVSIKLPTYEKGVLAFIEQMPKIKRFKEEIAFLKTGRKVELDAVRLFGLKRYFKDKLRGVL